MVELDKKEKCYSYSGRQTNTRKNMETNHWGGGREEFVGGIRSHLF